MQLRDENIETTWIQLLSSLSIDSRGEFFDLIAIIKWIWLMLKPLSDMYTSFHLLHSYTSPAVKFNFGVNIMHTPLIIFVDTDTVYN